MATDYADLSELAAAGTGLAASLHVRYRDPATGRVYNFNTGAFETWVDGSYASYKYTASGAGGITEQGTSGYYQWETPTAATLLPAYTFTVHRNVGGTPSTDPLLAEGEKTPEDIETETGETLPLTRRLPVRFRTATNVAFDPTGNTVELIDPTGTFGVRRQSTGAVVVPASPLQTYTRTGVGDYEYEVAETGAVLEYGFRYTNPDTAAVESDVLTSLPPSVHYAARLDIEKEIGRTNAVLHADLENNEDDEDVAEIIDSALEQADVRVNRKLATFSPPPAILVEDDEGLVTSTKAWVADAIRTAAAKYAAGMLLNKRSKQARINSNGEAIQTNGDLLIAEGDDILSGLPTPLPGVTLTTTDTSPGIDSLRNLSPAGAGLTECGCDGRPVVCQPLYALNVLN